MQLSQSEAISLYLWLALSFGVSFLKGASGEEEWWGRGDEIKNKFEKLKAHRSHSKERSLFPSADERICLGCLNDDMGQYKWEF